MTHNSFRLQKLIASTGLCSRRKAEDLLRKGRVTVNGNISTLGDKADPQIDDIAVDGRKIYFNQSPRVYLVNKPSGVISSCYDPIGRKTVLELLPKQKRLGIYPVGRLDINSRGAILLTNNGELSLKLTHPRYSHRKVYLVWISGEISSQSLYRWRNGLILDGLSTKPADVEVLRTIPGKTCLKVILTEGRNRQIRRVSELLGHNVVDLKRIAIAHLSLGNLDEGSWRELSPQEWNAILPTNNRSNQNITRTISFS